VITQAILTSLATKFQPVLLKYAREGGGGKVKSVRQEERDGAREEEEGEEKRARTSSRDPRRNNPRDNLDSWSAESEATEKSGGRQPGGVY